MRALLRAFGRRLARRDLGGSGGSSSRGRLPCPAAMGLYAIAVILVPLGLAGELPSGSCPEPVRVAAQARVQPRTLDDARSEASAAPADAARQRALSGLWWRYEPGVSGEPVRFYYFHGDGTGLYRYGRIGLTNTNSFDYDVIGDRLVLEFRKSGERHEVAFTLEHGREHGGDRDWLELREDPREPGASTRYFRRSEAIASPGADASAALGPAPAGHMWIDLQRHATGGQTFALYQFRGVGIDGRGTGWFHRGDFDDWSTEALAYRIVGDRLELDFTLADQVELTAFTVRTDADGRRWLELADDPRDFWHPHRYVDMGPSFGAALAPFELQPDR
jgi:hypothetical protein